VVTIGLPLTVFTVLLFVTARQADGLDRWNWYSKRRRHYALKCIGHQNTITIAELYKLSAGS